MIQTALFIFPAAGFFEFQELEIARSQPLCFRGQPQPEATTFSYKNYSSYNYSLQLYSLDVDTLFLTPLTLFLQGVRRYNVVSVALPPRDCRSTKRCIGTSEPGSRTFWSRRCRRIPSSKPTNILLLLLLLLLVLHSLWKLQCRV